MVQICGAPAMFMYSHPLHIAQTSHSIEKQRRLCVCFCGFNISILASLLMKGFVRLLGRWRGALVAVLAIAFYTLLVGAGASVVRAAIMGGLSLFARQVGR